MTVKLPGPGGERKSPSARIDVFILLVMGHHETIGWSPRRSGHRRGVDAGAPLPVRHNAEGMARPATAYGGLSARQQRRQLHRVPVASRAMREDEHLAPGDSHGCPGAGQSFFLPGVRGVGTSTWARAQFPDAPRVDLLDEARSQDDLADPSLIAADFRPAPPGSWVIVDEIQRLLGVGCGPGQPGSRSAARDAAHTSPSCRLCHTVPQSAPLVGGPSMASGLRIGPGINPGPVRH